MAGPGDKSFVVLRLKCEHDRAPLKGLPWKSDGDSVFRQSLLFQWEEALEGERLLG